MKTIAKFERSEQCTEDSWKAVEYFLEIDGSTTVQEIISWRDKITQRPIQPAHLQIPISIHFVESK